MPDDTTDAGSQPRTEMDLLLQILTELRALRAYIEQQRS